MCGDGLRFVAILFLTSADLPAAFRFPRQHQAFLKTTLRLSKQKDFP
jgi:hypothetical protein